MGGSGRATWRFEAVFAVATAPSVGVFYAYSLAPNVYLWLLCLFDSLFSAPVKYWSALAGPGFRRIFGAFWRLAGSFSSLLDVFSCGFVFLVVFSVLSDGLLNGLW